MPEKEKKKYSGQELGERLEAACRGLFFISETDSLIVPILAISDGGSLKDFVSGRTSADPAQIEEGSADAFFDRLTVDRSWHSPVDAARVGRYRRLESLMLRNLADVRMYRAGRVRIDIFVIGRDSEGNIAGIRTTAVET